MSISNLKAKDARTLATFEGREPQCFYCGDDVEDIAIIWKGHTLDATDCALIVLHPNCATDLGGEFIADARNAARLLNGKPLTAGIDPSLFPQGEA